MADDLVLGGLVFPGVGEGSTPIEGVLLLKALDSSGNMVLYQRFTRGISSWEALGLVEAASEVLKHDMRNYFQPVGDDGEPEGGDE